MAHILIVDDDSDFRPVFGRTLEPRGHTLSIVATAEEALEAVCEQPFDLVIIDLMLRGMDGAELARRLRAQPSTSRLPIVVVTSAARRLGFSFEEKDRAWLPVDIVVDKVEHGPEIADIVDSLLRRIGAEGGDRASVARSRDRLRHVPTTCPYCGAGCGLYLKARGSRLVGVVPSPAHPVSRGRLCAKGWTAFEPMLHPDRLRQPLIRKDGKLTPASWDAALDLCAARFTEIRQRGGDALGVFASARCTNEENYLAQKLARAVFGTNNIDHCARTCRSPSVEGLMRSFGAGAMTNSIEDIAAAACIFVIGSNVTEAHPLVAWRVRRARDGKANLIVADPGRTDVAEWADIHLQHMPGTDLALLNAMANVIISENLHDRRFIDERTEGFDEFRSVAARYSPEVAGEICGLPPDLIREAARIYALTRPAAILYTLGITEHTVGTENVMAVANLAMITGNVGKPSSGVNPLPGQNNVQGACDMGALPDYYPGYQRVDDAHVRRRFEQAWGVGLPPKPGLSVTDMLLAAGEGTVRGLYIIGEDPMRSEPNVALVEKRLRNLDFLVCQDIFMSETCRLADVVLPGAGCAEKDGTFTNSERRVQRVRKAVEPVGNSRPDRQIICELSARMGYPMDYADPSQVMDEVAALTPIYAGISFERVANVGLQWPCPDPTHPGTPFLHEGAFTRGKGRLHALEHRPPAETPDDQYPLVLSTGRVLFHYNVGTMTRRSEILSRESPRSFCQINPADARRYGIAPGRPVRVSTRRGTVVVDAEVTDRIRPGVIWMPLHFTETPANALTNDAFCPIARTGEYKACAARIEAVAPGQRGP